MTPTQRKLILYMSMSLDGFAARRDGTMDWLGEKQPHGAHRQRAVAELLGQSGMLVLGRRGGEEMAQAWPSSQSPTGELMNALPKVVFSGTLTDVEWANARVSDRPVEEEIPALKREPGKDIVVFGGASIRRSMRSSPVIGAARRRSRTGPAGAPTSGGSARSTPSRPRAAPGRAGTRAPCRPSR